VLAARDRENMARLTARLEEDHVVCVPYFDEDVHDIDGLAQVNRYLFSSSAQRREMLESAGV
jgi:short-subunit dehydrogenase